MKHLYLALMGLSVFFISCNKNDDNNDDNNDNPPANSRDWFKLKTFMSSSTYNNGSKYYYRDSTEITIDSANNKLVFRNYGSRTTSGNAIYSDSSVETYTYDGQNKLALYEKVSNYDRLYISRMEFVRDASGKLIKVLSAYKNGLMPTSEGTVKYDKRGDTTLVTFLDSARKHPDIYRDAQDFFQAGIVNDKVVYYKDYGWAPGYLDSTQTKYEYDAAGNLTTETYQYSNSTPVAYTYQRGSETPKELQKFLSQWAGDLFWFSRYKLFGFRWYLETVNANTGNVLLAKKQGNTTVTAYTNTFDTGANLGSVAWQAYAGSFYGIMTYTERYYYRP